MLTLNSEQIDSLAVEAGESLMDILLDKANNHQLNNSDSTNFVGQVIAFMLADFISHLDDTHQMHNMQHVVNSALDFAAGFEPVTLN